MEHFDVYVAGFEVNEDRATRGLMQVFGLSESAARIFVRSVPRMGKRRISREAAERYVRALQSVGGIVECRLSQPSGHPPSYDSASSSMPVSVAARMSLPLPSSTRAGSFAGQPVSSGSGSNAGAPLPEIPRAPRVPSELMHAEIPAWMELSQTYDNRLQSERAGTSSLPGVGEHYGSEQPDHSSSGPTPALHWPASDSLRTPSASGRYLDEPAPAYVSARPGPATHFSVVSIPKTPWYREGRSLLFVICVLAGAAFYGARHHWFETQRGLREAAWRAAGIDFGAYDDATHYLAQPEDRFDGLPHDKLETLLDALSRTGVAHTWVIGIRAQGEQRSGGSLLIELPKDATQRETIFWQHLKALTPSPINDTGQAYLQLDLAAPR